MYSVCTYSVCISTDFTDHCYVTDHCYDLGVKGQGQICLKSVLLLARQFPFSLLDGGCSYLALAYHVCFNP